MDFGFRQSLNEIRMGFLTLTRLPVGQVVGDVPGMAASAWAWPLVGLVVGGISAFILWIAVKLGVPAPLAACLAVLASVLATGGLHEDGLSDLSDGFGGGRTRDRILEIMRDSRIGAFGAIAIGFSLLIRIVAITGLNPCYAILSLPVVAAASRASMPLVLLLLPAARDDGLGHAAGGVSTRAVLAALGVGAGGLLFLGPSVALATCIVMGLAGTGLAALSLRKIGGQTGDVLGAMQQVTELAAWVTVAAALR